MKTYEEMAQSALARGKAMRKQQNKTNKIMIGTLSCLAACCLVILLALGIGEQGPNSGPGTVPPNPGPVGYLSPAYTLEIGKNGSGIQYISGTQNPGANGAAEQTIPRFGFNYGYITVVAKAINEVGVYETLVAYGSTQNRTYRVFAMQVIDPLESGMETGTAGTFFYLLPEHLQGDLTQYDALLISMRQLPKNFVLRGEDRLIADDYFFVDPFNEPEMGNIIAFTDGVFDESLWQGNGWSYGYELAKRQLDEHDDTLLVSRGSTLEEALQRRQAQIDEWGEWAKHATVKHYDFQTEAARQVMDYVKPFENGVFVPKLEGRGYVIRRYINGCPTNEWIRIDLEDETVTTSDYRFENADLENLPDLAAYITSLDLSKITPQHIDPERKLLIYNSAVGWYEKTENGVYAIVRIAWRYSWFVYELYDETFILLDEAGDHIISREELIELIGENQNISNQNYGYPLEVTVPA